MEEVIDDLVMKAKQKAVQECVDQELAAGKEYASATAYVEANRKESTQTQGKESESSESPSQADPTQDSTAPVPQQATSTRQAGMFHVSHTRSAIRPGVFDGCFKQGEERWQRDVV